MRRRSLILAAMLLLGAGAAWWWHRAPNASPPWEGIGVQRGPARHVLRETGVIESRDPVPVKAAFEGRIEWIIEDESWVEPGERVFVISDEEALKRVTEARTAVLNRRQELTLTRLRRRHVDRLEQGKVNAARRSLELATIRHRILSSKPQGGRRLLDLHERLVPLEAQTDELRRAYEQAQDTCQRAEDAYLERLDAWQQQQDAILRVQTKIDEYEIRSEAGSDDASAEEARARSEAAAQLAEQRSRIEALRGELPSRAGARDEAAAARDAARAPRDALRARLEEQEAEQKQLYIELEIEKRGAEVARLRIDREIAELTLAEAERKLEEGRQALSSGAISAASLEKLAAEAATARNELHIVDEKIVIASRPEPEEVLTEARLAVEQAEIRSRTAEQARERALQIVDHEIALLEAQMARARHDIERLEGAFATVIAFNIRFLEKEREGLDATEDERRAQIDEELTGLRAALERAQASPPNVGVSAVSGVVQLNGRWGRSYHAGDDVDEGTVIMNIYPALNLDVKATINETNVRLVRPGMSVRATVPALEGRALNGTIEMVGGIGRDKFEGMSDEDRAAFAGVTVFEVRIRLEAVPDTLRPGMTVVLDITVAEEADVLQVPRSAVRIDGDQGAVLLDGPDGPHRVLTRGRLFGDDLWVVSDGLTEGDVVLVERRGSASR